MFHNLIKSVHRESGSLELFEDVLVNNDVRDQIENHTIYASQKHLSTKVTQDFHLTYSKNGGNLGSESK